MQVLLQEKAGPGGKAAAQERNLELTTGPLMLALISGLIFVIVYGLAGGTQIPKDGSPSTWHLATAGRLVGTGLLIAAAFLALGMLLGFLFGVPRSAQEPTAAAPPAEGGAASASTASNRIKVNTNLEQISDWLTKILVGVGLTQFGQIPTLLKNLAGFVAKGMGDAPSDPLFAIGLILYFSICGFFTGYLLTRLFLAGAFMVADNMSEEALRQSQENKGEMESLRMEMFASGSSPAAVTALNAEAGLQGALPRGLPTRQTLAQEYNDIRARDTQSSEARTRAMSRVFSQMSELAQVLEEYDPAPDLRAKDGGSRLFAYAYLARRPNPALLDALVDCVTRLEEANFGQFQGITAIGKVLDEADWKVAPTVMERLETLLQNLRPDTARYYALNRLLMHYRAGRKKA
ncbi:MAG TPA: hypothetical protein VGB96_18870, partial [Archangium sp.]